MAALDIEPENECCICFGDMGNRCTHEFCLKCTLQHLYLTNDCPLCRRDVLPTKDYRGLIGDKQKHLNSDYTQHLVEEVIFLGIRIRHA